MRRALTITERILGLRAAIASPLTPEDLKQRLIRQLRKLEAGRPRKRRAAKKKGTGFLKWMTS